MKIRIKRELDENDPFGVADMIKTYGGDVATVLWAGSNEHGKYLRLDVDREEYFWSYGMVETVAVNKGKEG